MIVLNSYKSYYLVQFKEFCKEKNIVALYLPIHSSYFT